MSTTIIVWWLVCLIWSTVWLFIKIGVSDVPPFTFAALRLIIALAILAPFAVARWSAMGARDMRLIAGTGVLLLGVNYALLYWGAQYISSGLTAVLQAATPAFGLLFARWFLPDERLTAAKAASLALGITGVAVLFRDQFQAGGELALLGGIAVAGGALCVAFAYVVVKAKASHFDPLLLVTGQMLAAVGPLLLIALIKEGSPLAQPWTWKALAALAYLAIAGSVVAFWLNYWLLRRLSATLVLAMAVVEPLFAVLLGVIVLGETLQRETFIGGALILASVALLLHRG